MSRRTVLTLIGIIAVAAAVSHAQASAEFEVASVKLNTANDQIVRINVGPGDRFAASGYTLVLLIQRAYGVMDWNVSGGPAWIRTSRYDVAAKAGVVGNLTERQLQPRLQALLADRFKLRLRREWKAMSGYALVVGKGGPKIKAASAEEPQDTFRMNASDLSMRGILMADFARYVGGKLGVVVVDKTELQGVYDLQAQWTVDPAQNAGGPTSVDPREALRHAVFDALEDQLGLKIIPQQIQVQMLVIDNVEQPSAN